MKRTVFKILTMALCLALCGMFFAGCEQAQAGPVDSRTLSLDQTEMTVVIGQEAAKLTAILSSGRGAFEWASSDTQVVTVDENGKVAGVSVGSATVTVQCGTLEPASCLVHVVLPSYMPVFAADPSGMGISKTIAQGGTLALDSTVRFNGEAVQVELSYLSQDPAIAAVSETGVITGVKAGTTRIQAVATYMELEVHMTVEVTVVSD